MPASPMGRFVPCSHGQTARLGNNVLHSLCPPKVKHVVPNDLFETNLLTEILVYTMDAADARKKIEDANRFCGKKPSTDDELAAMMASSCSKNRFAKILVCIIG
jgi:hypothetical protein